jgi:regulator of RNase E activity RraB
MLPGKGKRLPGKGKRTREVERIDDAREADERVLDHLARLGCDPSAPRETHHFLYLPAQSDAEAVAHALGDDGWSTFVEQSEGAWLVVATRARTLTLELVRETRGCLATLASEHGGLYDGWEAPTT